MTTYTEESVKERFVEGVKGHSMEIVKDDGVFRHLVFSNNGSFNLRFMLTTWPGYLAISGDMGCYVFSRVNDMFCFFRRDALEINSGYWAEKVQAAARHEGVTEFDPEKFRQVTIESIEAYFEDSPEAAARCKEAFESEVLYYLEDYSQDEMRRLAADFRFEGDCFADLLEGSTERFTYRYLWCLHAIVWGIQRYDSAKAQVANAIFNSEV